MSAPAGSLRVVGVDPGPTPGAVMLVCDGANVCASVFQCDRHSIRWLAQHLLESSSPVDGRVSEVTFQAFGLVVAGADIERRVLAVERFVVGPRSARLGTAKAAADTRNMVGELMSLGGPVHGLKVVLRSAAEVMPWATDRRLDAAGLLKITKGMPHARAAARHALFAAVRDGQLPDPLSRSAQ